jgi:hypothetical protein
LQTNGGDLEQLGDVPLPAVTTVPEPSVGMIGLLGGFLSFRRPHKGT